jgi:hypothetical protein
MLTQKLMGAGGAGGELTLALTASATANLTRASLPAVSAGDFLVVIETANLTSATQVTPSGWTSAFFYSDTSGAYGLITHCVIKVSDGTETGTVDPTTDTTPYSSIIMVFSGGVTALGSILDLDTEAGKQIPTAQVKNATTIGTSPKLILAHWAHQETAVVTRGFAGDTPDGELSSDTSNYVKYLFYGASDTESDITVTWAGATDRVAGMASVIIEVT